MDFFVWSSLKDHGVKILASAGVTTLLYHAVCFQCRKHKWFVDLPTREKNLYTTSLIGFVHALVALSLSIPTMLNPPEELVADYFWGISDWVCTVFSISCGYFLWDFFTCVYQRWDASLIAHGLLCFFVYFFCLKAHQTYSNFFLFFEFSTIFLNLRPVLKHAKIGPPISTVMDALFALSFFFSRIFLGIPISLYFQRDVYLTISSGSYKALFPILFLAVANLILCTLNLYWFSKIVAKFLSTRRKGSRADKSK